MRKLFKLILLSCTLLLLAACSMNTGEAASVDEVKMDEVEQQLMASLMDQYFFYELKIKDQDIRNIYWGIDVYRKGKLVQEKPFGSTPLDKDDVQKPVKLFIARQAKDIPEAKWISTVYKASGNFGITAPDDMAKYLKDKPTGGQTGPYPLTLKKGKKKVLSHITATDKDDSYQDAPKETKKEIEALPQRYDTVFSVWIKLK